MHRADPVKNCNGFSLIIVVVVFVSTMILVLGGSRMIVKIKQVSNKRVTVQRMETILKSSKQYYSSNQDLFLANLEENASSNIQIPGSRFVRYGVVPSILSLGQEYRTDKFGKFFEYHIVEQSSDENGITEIQSVTIDGVPAAGVIISYGANQVRDCTIPDNSTNSYVSAGDDILVPINLMEEARKIALKEMNVIRKKLWIFAMTNPPGTSVPKTFYDDYGLGDSYKTDPWGNPYILGSDYIQTSNGEIFLSLLVLDDDYGTDRLGKKPSSIPVAGSAFGNITDDKVDFGSGGRFTGDVYGSVTEAINGGLYFNRSAGGGYVYLGNQLDNYLGYNFSLSARIYSHDNHTKGNRIFVKDEYYIPAISNPTGWSLSLADGNQIGVLRFYSRSLSPVSLDTSNIIPENMWRHVAAVAQYDQVTNTTDKLIYVDGQLVAEGADLDNFIPDNDAPLAVGGDPNSSSHRFDGIIRQPAVYNKALTHCEIRDIYTGIPCYFMAENTCNNVVGFNDFNGWYKNSSNEYVSEDSADSACNGIIHGRKSFVPDRFNCEGTGGWAMDFNDDNRVQKDTYIELPEYSINGLDAITIAGWVYLENGTGGTNDDYNDGRFFSSGGSGHGQVLLWPNINHGPKGISWIVNTDAGDNRIDTGNTDKGWLFIAGVWETSAAMRVYVWVEETKVLKEFDLAVGSVVGGTIDSGYNKMYIGRDAANTNYFTGIADNYVVLDICLSKAEILTLKDKM